MACAITEWKLGSEVRAFVRVSVKEGFCGRVFPIFRNDDDPVCTLLSVKGPHPLPQIVGMLMVEFESEEEEEAEKLRLVEGNLWSDGNLSKFKEYGDDEDGFGIGGAVRSRVTVGCNGERAVCLLVNLELLS